MNMKKTKCTVSLKEDHQKNALHNGAIFTVFREKRFKNNPLLNEIQEMVTSGQGCIHVRL